MTVKHQPATPLPFHVVEQGGTITIYSAEQVNILDEHNLGELTAPEAKALRKELRYLTHAGNAYPKLVTALKQALLAWEKPNPTHTATYRRNYERLAGLLRDLGEES